jgi:hypothetical protein
MLWELVSPKPEADGRFGWTVSGAGDVNDDGYPDMIVGASNEDGGTHPEDAGRAYVFGGGTGATPPLLYTFVSPNQEVDGAFGICVSGAGDVNNDGYADVIVGAYYEDPGSGPTNAGRAYVFSGATGDTLYELVSPNEEAHGHFGAGVSGAGDVNNDGHADVIVGAPDEDPPGSPTNAGRAYVFSGATGDTLYELVSPNAEAGGTFGQWGEVSGAGDVNNDGYADVIVGAGWEDPGTSPTNAGRAYVFSGATGDTLYTLVSPNEQDWGGFGFWVSGVGDADADGYDDLVVGAPGEDPGASPEWAGRAYVFSGQTGDTLYTLVSPNEQEDGVFGNSVSGAGDVDGDGYPDVVVGACWESPGGVEEAGRAYIFSGQTGALLCTMESPNGEYLGNFGDVVSGIGDVNAGGDDAVIIGAHFEAPDSTGRAYVFVPRMILSGDLSEGELVLDWTAWPGASAYWVYGADNEAYFVPGLVDPWNHRLAVLSPDTTWASASGVSDPDHNWTYQVIAVDASEQEMCRSNRAGEWDYGLEAP